MAKVIAHPPALLSPFKQITGTAHPSLLPQGVPCDVVDTENGKALGMRDAERVRRGQTVTIPAFVDTAGACYKRGYLHGLVNYAAAGGPGIVIFRQGVRIGWPFDEKLSYAGASVRLALP